MFSDNETKVLQILGKEKMTIADLTDRFYGRLKPFDAPNAVASIVRRIVGKCNHYGLTWTIEGEGLGRHGRTVWRINRKKRQ